jgi:hypothetical protein
MDSIIPTTIPNEYVPKYDDCSVGIHLKLKTERNPTVAVVAFYTSDHGCERNFRSRGISPIAILFRKMTQDEFNCYSNCWRFMSVSYETYLGLIKDEFYATNDIKWVKKLHTTLGMRKNLYDIIGHDLVAWADEQHQRNIRNLIHTTP